EGEMALQRHVGGHVDQGRFEHAVAEVRGVGAGVEQALAGGARPAFDAARARRLAPCLPGRGHGGSSDLGNGGVPRTGDCARRHAPSMPRRDRENRDRGGKAACRWPGAPGYWRGGQTGAGRMSRIQRIFAWGLFSLVLLVLSGWLLADHLTPRAFGVPSHTLPLQPAQTELDREIVPLGARHGGETGIIVVPDGLDAFAARALSARKAGRSLDLQYYIWHNDPTGRLLAHEAWKAAERGVRVRILLDDLNTKGDDAD